MDEEIPKTELDAIRSLNDGDLVKLITEISHYGWPKAEPLLRLLMMEGESHD
jgi:hypothetical protein